MECPTSATTGHNDKKVAIFGGGGGDGVPHSGHEAKAALILRRDAVQVVIDWWNSTLLCQKSFRGHQQLVKYRETKAMRAKAATTMSGFFRTHLFAKKYKKYLLRQQKSHWEQLWDEDAACFYWFNKSTSDNTWEEPNIPYRPMLRDR